MPRATRQDARVDVAVGAACVVAALVCMALPTATRDSFAGFLRASLMAPLVALQERAELGRRTFAGHDASVVVADSVALRSLRMEGVEQENEKLRALLGLGASLRWGFVPAEALRGRTVGDETTLILSAGTRAGVEPLSAVVSDDGLVGMIERADATMSSAIVWQHPEFRVSGISTDGEAYGIVQAVRGQGADRFFLEMRGVLLRAQLKPGALIVTSGLGGVYPRGIPIGTVVGELKTSDQWARGYLIKPAVPLANIGTVLVLKPERSRAGVENVWASAAGADSAARRIVSVIDSIARLTGDSSTVRQRRALADSGRTAAPVVPAAPRVPPDSTRRKAP
jgi:rod shape-determining protein MreC